MRACYYTTDDCVSSAGVINMPSFFRSTVKTSVNLVIIISVLCEREKDFDYYYYEKF